MTVFVRALAQPHLVARLTAVCATLLVVVAALPTGPTHAKAVQQIQWKTLLPDLPPLVDPLAHLTDDQRFDLETIMWVRTLTPQERKIEPNILSVEDAERFEVQFKKAGIDIDELIATYSAWDQKRARRQKLVNSKLDQKTIRMPGYLLPLSFTEGGETEFLLVPYLGACVHTPPPPPNQIVSVKLTKPMQVEDLFTPVWITGEMNVKTSETTVQYDDGSRRVVVGYHLENATTVPYSEE